MIPFRENEVYALGPGVYIREAIDNCVWADLGDGVVVIDALEDPAMAVEIEKAVAETVGKPIRWVINTHWHADHIACNPRWAANGSTIIAHESCAPRTDERDGKPDITFSERYRLTGSERAVDLEWLGGTHTPADTVVHFSWARILHIADLFGWGLFPLQRITPDTVERMRQVIRRVLTYDVDLLVCGHGPTLTLDHLRRWLEYFDALVEKGPGWKSSGLNADALKEQVPPPDDMADWWRFAAWKHARNLEQITAAHWS